MTIIEAISRLDSIKPNTYSQSDKVRWLSQLDGMIKVEIIDTHEGKEKISFEPYTDETDVETALLVPHPYDSLYISWLSAQVDYHNGEIKRYSNSYAVFNNEYSDYANYYNRTHMPDGANFKYF